MRGEVSTGLQFGEALLASMLAAIPFVLMSSLAALANSTPATRRGMLAMLGQQPVMLAFGITIMMLRSTFIPQHALLGRVLEVCMVGCLAPAILCGIVSTLQQIRLGQQAHEH